MVTWTIAGDGWSESVCYFWRLFDSSAVHYEMVRRCCGGFTADASDHAPNFLHWSLAVELRDVWSPTVSLAQFDCAPGFGAVNTKVWEVGSINVVWESLQGFLAVRNRRFASQHQPPCQPINSHCTQHMKRKFRDITWNWRTSMLPQVDLVVAAPDEAKDLALGWWLAKNTHTMGTFFSARP